MSDIQVYPDVLEFIGSAAGREGVRVLFRILGRDGEKFRTSGNFLIPAILDGRN